MGRPRKTLSEHLAKGNYRPCRHGPLSSEPEESPLEAIEKPTKLDADAGRVWDELSELLAGVIRRRDIPALTELCRWTARADRIAKELDVLSPADKLFKGLLIAAGIATDKISDLTKRFGISPADRQRLGAGNAAPTVAKVPVRGPTKLDKSGPPKKAK